MSDTADGAPKQYPIAYVKGGRTRLAASPQSEVRLRYDGWRPQDEPEHVPGNWLPAPPPPPETPGSEPGQLDATPPPDKINAVVPSRRRAPKPTR